MPQNKNNKIEEWKKEFDNTYKSKFHGAWFVKEGWIVAHKKDLIKFISHLLSQERQKVLEEILPEERKMEEGKEEFNIECNGFNQCRQQIIENFIQAKYGDKR